MSDFGIFIDLVYGIKDKEMLEDFFIGITTAKERDELAKRLLIVEGLLAHQTHKQIAKSLGVGVATVTRGSKELAAGRFKYLRD